MFGDDSAGGGVRNPLRGKGGDPCVSRGRFLLGDRPQHCPCPRLIIVSVSVAISEPPLLSTTLSVLIDLLTLSKLPCPDRARHRPR